MKLLAGFLSFLVLGAILPTACGMIAGSVVSDWLVPVAERHQSVGMIGAAYAAVVAAGTSGFWIGRIRRC